METLLINEQFVSQFKFWREGKIRTGMRFRNNLFEYVSRYDHHQRDHVFDLAGRLAELQQEVIVTVSPHQYMIWINLRTVNQSLGRERVGSAQTSVNRTSQALFESALSA